MRTSTVATLLLFGWNALAAPTPSEHAFEDSIIAEIMQRRDHGADLDAHHFDLQKRNTYPFSQMVAFGDNLSDNGNGSYAHCVADPSNCQNTIYGARTWTDGPVAVSYLAGNLGVPLALDYAYGHANGGSLFGATIDNAFTQSTAKAPSAKDQVGNYTSNIFLKAAAAKSLHFLWIGANDINLYHINTNLANNKATFAQPMAQKMSALAQSLLSFGGSTGYVVVPNLYPKQISPSSQFYASNSTQLANLGTAINDANAAIKAALAPLGSKVIYVDVNYFMTALWNQHANFGITHVNGEFCDGYSTQDFNECIYQGQGKTFYWMQYLGTSFSFALLVFRLFPPMTEVPLLMKRTCASRHDQLRPLLDGVLHVPRNQSGRARPLLSLSLSLSFESRGCTGMGVHRPVRAGSFSLRACNVHERGAADVMDRLYCTTAGGTPASFLVLVHVHVHIPHAFPIRFSPLLLLFSSLDRLTALALLYLLVQMSPYHVMSSDVHTPPSSCRLCLSRACRSVDLPASASHCHCDHRVLYHLPFFDLNVNVPNPNPNVDEQTSVWLFGMSCPVLSEYTVELRIWKGGQVKTHTCMKSVACTASSTSPSPFPFS